MEWWQAIILGLVEGITEFLPVSSTGHLIIASGLMGLDDPALKSAVDAFNIVIQGGAILAVAGLYWPRIVQMLRGLLGRDERGRRLMINLFVAFLPAAILGPLLDDRIGTHLFHIGPVMAALFLGGVWMIWLDKRHSARESARDARELESGPDEGGLTIDTMTMRHALLIGLFQCVAMWPGTSRSMMTIAGGVTLGLRRRDAAEFSFLLGLPTLGGACVYKLGKNLRHSHAAGEPNLFEVLGVWPVVIGVVVATLSAALAVKWLVSFLTRHGLAAFGWYRIAVCLVLGALALAGVVRIGG